MTEIGSYLLGDRSRMAGYERDKLDVLKMLIERETVPLKVEIKKLRKQVDDLTFCLHRERGLIK